MFARLLAWPAHVECNCRTVRVAIWWAPVPSWKNRDYRSGLVLGGVRYGCCACVPFRLAPCGSGTKCGAGAEEVYRMRGSAVAIIGTLGPSERLGASKIHGNVSLFWTLSRSSTEDLPCRTRYRTEAPPPTSCFRSLPT